MKHKASSFFLFCIEVIWLKTFLLSFEKMFYTNRLCQLFRVYLYNHSIKTAYLMNVLIII